MEQALLKLARQLNAIDEASLTALWEKYAAEAERFEPGKRWEEAVLALGMIQAVRWKNLLFNEKWREMTQAEPQGRKPSKLELVASPGADAQSGEEPGRKRKLLLFPGIDARQGEKPTEEPDGPGKPGEDA